ncbi:MAG: hypothetical protein EA382_18995 [Spirochaetaceae bacterium]|nr:MAG: hypothetical protein EA382_18995 [Spirochaetaceae bacterium]
MAQAYPAAAGIEAMAEGRRLVTGDATLRGAAASHAATKDVMMSVRNALVLLASGAAVLLAGAMLVYAEPYEFRAHALSDLGLTRVQDGTANGLSALLFAAAMFVGCMAMARCAALFRTGGVPGAAIKRIAAIAASVGYLAAIFPHDSFRAVHFAGCAAMVGGLWALTMLFAWDLARDRRYGAALLVTLILNLPMLPYAGAFVIDADGKQSLQKLAVAGLIAALVIAVEALKREASSGTGSASELRLPRRRQASALHSYPVARRRVRSWQAQPGLRSAERSALVISGGGSKGAFAVGVLRDLYDRYRSHGWFSIVGGSSTGALIAPAAAMLAAPGDVAERAMEALEESYTMLQTTDVLERHTWLDLMRRRDALNSSKPLQRLLEETVHDSWFAWLRSDDAPLCYVVYTNLRTGARVVATPRDPGMTRQRFLEAMLASASVPGIMEATRIDGDPCFDGTLRDLVPADFAVESGATTMLPILLDPQSQEWDGPLDRFDRILARAFAVLVDEVGRNDLEIPRLQVMGRTVRDALLGIRRITDGMTTSPQARALRAALDAILKDPELAPLLHPQVRLNRIVDGIRPRYALTDDALDFSPEHMRRWYEHGLEVSRTVLREAPF